MKKQILFCVFLFFLFNNLVSQEFSFQMYFEDAEGNRDTITIGYDPNGSRDTINPDFGEVNIVDIPFDSIFDVRITNQVDINGASWNYEYELYHSKKKIVNTIKKIVNIDIHAIHWPVTAMWDPELFDNPELNGSLFTSLNKNFWWDHGGYYSNLGRKVLHEQDQVTFTANYPDNWEEHPIEEYWGVYFCYYTDIEGNPLATYWVALGDSTWLYLSSENILRTAKTVIFPNPTDGVVFIEDNGLYIRDVYVYDITGKRYFLKLKENKLDISNLPDGIYLIKIIYYNEKTETHKIIKSKRKNNN